MRQIHFLALAASLILIPNEALAQKVKLTESPGKVRVEIGGKLFTEYNYENTSRPFLYPIIGPGGVGMTRNWPMKDGVEGEEKDHPHHKGWWYSHGAVNGHDFWSEAKEAGKTAHDGFIEVKSGDKGVIKSKNKLVAKDGTIVATDERTLTFYDAPYFDFEVTTKASNGDVVFGDTKEGTMAIRLNEEMRLKRKAAPGKGTIINSEGVKNGETWGKRAKWVDYYGPAEGKTVGVAIFDDPKNPRHPTWWHVRDYGLFAANPFGVHDFEKKEKGAGDMKLKAGDSVTFRYRFYFHEGDEKQGDIAAKYADFAAGK